MASIEKTRSDDSDNRLLVRGADNNLYLLPEKDLAPYKFDPDLAREVTKFLEDSNQDPLPEPLEALPKKLEEKIRSLLHIGHHISVYINNVPNQPSINPPKS